MSLLRFLRLVLVMKLELGPLLTMRPLVGVLAGPSSTSIQLSHCNRQIHNSGFTMWLCNRAFLDWGPLKPYAGRGNLVKIWLLLPHVTVFGQALEAQHSVIQDHLLFFAPCISPFLHSLIVP